MLQSARVKTSITTVLPYRSFRLTCKDSEDPNKECLKDLYPMDYSKNNKSNFDSKEAVSVEESGTTTKTSSNSKTKLERRS